MSTCTTNFTLTPSLTSTSNALLILNCNNLSIGTLTSMMSSRITLEAVNPKCDGFDLYFFFLLYLYFYIFFVFYWLRFGIVKVLWRARVAVVNYIWATSRGRWGSTQIDWYSPSIVLFISFFLLNNSTSCLVAGKMWGCNIHKILNCVRKLLKNSAICHRKERNPSSCIEIPLGANNEIRSWINEP